MKKPAHEYSCAGFFMFETQETFGKYGSLFHHKSP